MLSVLEADLVPLRQSASSLGCMFSRRCIIQQQRSRRFPQCLKWVSAYRSAAQFLRKYVFFMTADAEDRMLALKATVEACALSNTSTYTGKYANVLHGQPSACTQPITYVQRQEENDAQTVAGAVRSRSLGWSSAGNWATGSC